MEFGIRGKRALVLGASRGLGAASAEALVAEGVDVHAISRSGAVPDSRIHGFAADLSGPAGVEAVLEFIAVSGPFDILVANTGGPRPSGAQAIASEEWVANFQAMAVSLFQVADAVLPGMIAGGWGRIITIGSTGIVQPLAGLAISNAIRGSVAGWSKTLATEVAPHGVTVNMVLPGRIDTDRVREIDLHRSKATELAVADVVAQSVREIPAGRYGKPGEFGAVVAFLASQQAAYVTGSMMRVDGGLVRGL